ncbi:MAG: penicillin-binding protein 1C [Saprospiraceae bacterium]|nr:penicillin-binding protein 1C [Saprospiraceae bacterium]
MTRFRTYFLIFLFAAFLALIWASSFRICEDYSKVVYSHQGSILSMKTAKDGQWRFPSDSKHSKHSMNYEQALLLFEDRNFYFHLGIDPIALVRSIYLNVKHRKIISGGSTITMQLARLLLKSSNRSVWSKIKECYLALGLELRYSKKDLLRLYTQIAPYGSNVVGFDAAIFRYYNKSMSQLSWAEAALLAILPNQPSWLHISKNRGRLLEKRNLLLNKLEIEGKISNADYELSLLEPLPEQPLKVVRLAPHALDYLEKKYPEKNIFHSTIDDNLQNGMRQILIRHHEVLKQNEIRNAAAMIIDNRNQKILSYHGNVLFDTIKAPQAEVNMIHAPRSSGSILKPLLIASAIDHGILVNSSLIPDIPVLINGFRPENFSRTYMGACTAQELIKYSLNIPSILVLKDIGVSQFYNELIKLNFSNLFREPEDYGLSLILGGAEINMWDLCRAYSYLIYTQDHFDLFGHKYLPVDSFDLSLLDGENINTTILSLEAPVFTAGSIADMFIAMRNTPPLQNQNITSEDGQFPIAWKTGTSFGYKDAWCIGITPNYTVAVWLGNSNGLSRHGLIGIETAAPIVFEIMYSMPQQIEWKEVYDSKSEIVICKQSGYKANSICLEKDTVFYSKTSKNLKDCPYHQNIFVDSNNVFQVNADCYASPITKSVFILPPLMAYYYKQHHINYKDPPPYSPNCVKTNNHSINMMEFIYPNPGTSIALPIDFDDKLNAVIFKAVHSNPKAEVFWFLDNDYLGSTRTRHEISCKPETGKHWLSISDQSGNTIRCKISVTR